MTVATASNDIGALEDGSAKPSATDEFATADAFLLGWRVGLMYGRSIPDKAQSLDAAPARLVASRDLRGVEEIQSDVAGIRVAINGLERAQGNISAELPNTEDLEACLQEIGGDNAAARIRLSQFRLHLGLLRALMATGAPFGDAYDLGCAMAEMSRLPAGKQLDRLKPHLASRLRAKGTPRGVGPEPDEAHLRTAWLREAFGRHRVDDIAGRLQDLASALPAHAGRSVARSVEAFGASVQAGTRSMPANLNWDSTRIALERQGLIWRSLLAGEKQAFDMLTAENYIEVARRWFRSSRTLFRAYVRLFWFPVLILVLLLAGAVVAAVQGHTAGSIASALAAALAAVAGTRGAKASVGRIAGEFARPLWQRQAEEVVADTITQPLNPAPRESTRAVVAAPSQ
jgi:hypothetical protein